MQHHQCSSVRYYKKGEYFVERVSDLDGLQKIVEDGHFKCMTSLQ